MKPLQIAATKNSPEISFDEVSCIFLMKGVSTMADAKSFYEPLIEWIIQSDDELNKETVFEFHLPYFNSSSNKCIYRVIEALAVHIKHGKLYQFIWCVEEDDEFMRDGGEAIAELLGLEFQYRQVPFNPERLF